MLQKPIVKLPPLPLPNGGPPLICLLYTYSSFRRIIGGTSVFSDHITLLCILSGGPLLEWDDWIIWYDPRLVTSPFYSCVDESYFLNQETLGCYHILWILLLIIKPDTENNGCQFYFYIICLHPGSCYYKWVVVPFHDCLQGLHHFGWQLFMYNM